MDNLKQTNNDIEKIKKSLKDFGNTFFALGWLGLIVGSIFLVLTIFSNFSFSFGGYGVSDFILIIIEGIILIVLAGRIKNNVLDGNNRNYIVAILILYIINTILRLINLEAGGSFIVVFFTIYAIITLVSFNKVLKNEEFRNMLEFPRHKITKRDWVIFAVVSFLLLYCAIYFDLNYNTALWRDEDFMSNEEFIEVSISEMKEELPMVIDEVTTLKDVYGKDDVLHYHLELSKNYKLSEEFINLMEESVIIDTCNTEDVEIFFNRGISMKYIYSDHFGNEDFIIVNSDDCLD